MLQLLGKEYMVGHAPCGEVHCSTQTPLDRQFSFLFPLMKTTALLTPADFGASGNVQRQ